MPAKQAKNCVVLWRKNCHPKLLDCATGDALALNEARNGFLTWCFWNERLHKILSDHVDKLYTASELRWDFFQVKLFFFCVVVCANIFFRLHLHADNFFVYDLQKIYLGIFAIENNIFQDFSPPPPPKNNGASLIYQIALSTFSQSNNHVHLTFKIQLTEKKIVILTPSVSNW